MAGSESYKGGAGEFFTGIEGDETNAFLRELGLDTGSSGLNAPVQIGSQVHTAVEGAIKYEGPSADLEHDCA